MKRALLVLFLLMLPLQAVWAAVGDYCATGEKQAFAVCVVDCLQAAQRADGDESPAASLHGDCSVCHLGHSLASSAMQPPPSPHKDLPAMAMSARLKSDRIAARPERPQWSSQA